MRTHTSTFKDEIKKLGREIKGKIVYYNNYNLITENSNNILTEDNLQLITEQPNYSEAIEINENDIFSIEIIKNGNLLQSLMKQFNFEAKIELNLGTIVNPQLGLLVDKEEQEYEYLDYGNYYIYSKEYNIDMDTWSYVCYDKMLFSMIKFRGLSNITYPITIKEYLIKLCEKVGLDFENTNFVNYNQLIYEDIFKNRDITYRDLFDEISKIAGGNLLINDSDKLEVVYPTVTNDIIDDNYLKDTNVKANKQVGPVNSVAIYDSENDIQYVAEDSQSIKQFGLTRITITDNLIALNGETQDIADNIFNQLEGLIYYENDFTTTGVCYYDFLDLFTVEARGETYPCLLLNNEITISQGIEEHIFTEELEELETKTNQFTTSIMTNKQVQFKIDQQEGKIESRVEKDGVISAINQSAEEIQIQANKIKLEGYTTINEGFTIDEEGNMTANNGTFNGLISAGNINVGAGYTELNPYIFVGDMDNNGGINPYGVRLWDNGISVFDYRGDGVNYPLVRTEQAGGGFSQLKGMNIECTGNVTSAMGVCQGSLKEIKKNFEKLKNAKEILSSVDIYKYNLKEEKDNDKKHIGFVISHDFNYSKEITSKDNKSVDLYSMISVLWQVVKEQQEEIDKLKEVISNGKY